jgi:hypothetical protein
MTGQQAQVNGQNVDGTDRNIQVRPTGNGGASWDGMRISAIDVQDGTVKSTKCKNTRRTCWDKH